MLNPQIWNLYKTSEDGKKAIALFDLGEHPKYEEIQKIADCMETKHGDFPSDFNSEWFVLWEVNVSCMETPATREEFEKYVTNFDLVNFSVDEKGELQFHEDQIVLPNNRYREKNAWMQLLSMALYIQNPSLYKPIFYQTRFPNLMRNCDVLGIELPPIPRTKDYKQYMMYYLGYLSSLERFSKRKQPFGCRILRLSLRFCANAY